MGGAGDPVATVRDRVTSAQARISTSVTLCKPDVFRDPERPLRAERRNP